MSNGLDEVRIVMFYTRSSIVHNRQIVVIMKSNAQYRFSEDEMQQEIEKYRLSESTLRVIELSAYRRAMRFDQNTPDWAKVQKLMCQFQTELERLYG